MEKKLRDYPDKSSGITVAYASMLKIDKGQSVVVMPYIGHDSKDEEVNSHGYLRSHTYFFGKLLKDHPEWFSEVNTSLIEDGYPPLNDAQFREHFPEYDQESLYGELLIHHHVGKCDQAVAIPDELHRCIHRNEENKGVDERANIYWKDCEQALKNGVSLEQINRDLGVDMEYFEQYKKQHEKQHEKKYKQNNDVSKELKYLNQKQLERYLFYAKSLIKNLNEEKKQLKDNDIKQSIEKENQIKRIEMDINDVNNCIDKYKLKKGFKLFDNVSKEIEKQNVVFRKKVDDLIIREKSLSEVRQDINEKLKKRQNLSPVNIKGKELLDKQIEGLQDKQRSIIDKLKKDYNISPGEIKREIESISKSIPKGNFDLLKEIREGQEKDRKSTKLVKDCDMNRVR